MTRINCIPVSELTDQHLLAEYREMPRVSKLAKILPTYEEEYKMGTGHVKFFYDKGKWLKARFAEICQQCKLRGLNIQFSEYRDHPAGLNKGWSPSIWDEMINASRINDRIDANRKLYKYYKVKIDDSGLYRDLSTPTPT